MQRHIQAIKNEAAYWWQPQTRHREGPISFKRYDLDSGVTGLNLGFTLAKVGIGYFTPRHRHNHDQIRYVLEGDLNIGNGRDLKQGECGYFGEGVYYGPQDQQKNDAYVLTLQFPGASGLHFMSYEELDAAYQLVKSGKGSFDNGVYRATNDEGSKVQKDGFQILWETNQQKALVYPKGRYDDIVVMNPETYNWLPDPTRAGLESKHLGTFSEMRTGLSLRRWQAGFEVESEILDVPEIWYVSKGEVVYNGESYETGSCFFISDATPTAAFHTSGGVEFFVIALPMLLYWET